MSAPPDPSPTSSTPTDELPWWARTSTQPALPPAKVRTRSWTARTVVTALTVAVAVVFTMAAAAGQVPERTPTPFGYAYPASPQALVAGCTDRYAVTTTTEPDGVVPDTTPSGVPFRPTPPGGQAVPVRGFMYAPPAPTSGSTFFSPSQVNVPSPYRLLNNMYGGALVVYYDPEMTKVPGTDLQTDVTALRDLAASDQSLSDDEGGLRLIVAPWPSGAGWGKFPGRRPLAVAAWGTVQYCYRLVANELLAFRNATPADSAPGAALGTPPRVLPESVWGPVAAGTAGARVSAPTATPTGTATTP